MKKKKLAIVVSGGALKCAYSAGCLKAIRKKFPDLVPDILIGNSGGAPNVCYYAADQCEVLEDIWLNEIATPRFVSLLRLNKIMDIDYVIEEIIGNKKKLDLKKLKNSKSEVFISATRLKNGKAVYFSSKKDDMLLALKASTAIPILYNRSVEIDGKKYFDGAISSDIEKSVEKAIKEGAEKILIIDTSAKAPLVYRLIKKMFKKELNLEDYKIFSIEPNRKLSFFVNFGTKEDLKDIFNMGYNETYNNKSLEEFLYL